MHSSYIHIRVILFIIFLSCLSLKGYGQVNVLINATGKHKRALDGFQKAARLVKKNKKDLNDSIQSIRRDTTLTFKQKRNKIHEYKSLLKEQVKDRNPFSDTLAHIIPHLQDSADLFSAKNFKDSLLLSVQLLAKDGNYSEIRRLYENLKTLNDSGLDTVLIQNENDLLKIVEDYLPPEFKNKMADNESFIESILPDLNRESLPHQDFGSLVTKIPDQSVDNAVKRVQSLKGKYSSLPDSRYPDQGIKNNSLKNKHLINRLIFGGNIRLASTDPIKTDITLQLGFQINKKISIGSNLIWRETFHPKDTTKAKNLNSAHGYGLYLNYHLPFQFFLNGTINNLQKSPLFSEKKDDDSWDQQYLIGIGRQIRISKFIQITSTLQYDFTHKSNPFNGPWLFMIGYVIAKPKSI